ncbi:MAG: 3-isopropylmalate dehydratase small subunit [candidate division Zixibacteria bacterium]|nr:3-isopropylmalate dehydratase small subunit [candidate division Zixibacteria bacterium]
MIDKIKGRVWKLGDNIDTDVIYPGKYLPIIDAEEMAKHALEGMDKDFPKRIKKGDIIIAGRNFGCGSSREQAATCLKFAGIGCVIAKSFSRIFFRNAINQGLALVQSSDLLENTKEGDEITIDFSSNQIVTKNKSFPFPALDGFVMGILEDGGLIEHTKKVLGKNKKGAI